MYFYRNQFDNISVGDWQLITCIVAKFRDRRHCIGQSWIPGLRISLGNIVCTFIEVPTMHANCTHCKCYCISEWLFVPSVMFRFWNWSRYQCCDKPLLEWMNKWWWQSPRRIYANSHKNILTNGKNRSNRKLNKPQVCSLIQQETSSYAL